MTARAWPGLVIGVGNPTRGDDGVGPRVAAELARRGVAAIPHPGDGADLLDRWAGDRPVIIVDAMQGPWPPGTIRRFDAVLDPPPAEAFVVSSHALGLGWAIGMARALGRLPPALVIYGIAAGAFAHGSRPSPEVLAASEAVVVLILAEIGAQP